VADRPIPAAPLGDGTPEHPLPPPSFKGRFAWLRKISFGPVAFLMSFVAFVLGILTLAIGGRRGSVSYAVVKLWAWAIIRVSGCHVRVEGIEKLDPDTPRLIVANHCSWYDPPTIWATFPGQVRFVLKKELTKAPFIGWYASAAGHFLLDRANPREGMKLIETAIARARELRLSPMVFPEGTRSDDGRLATLRAGAFELALKGGLEVQPIAILGTFAIWPRGLGYPRCAGEILVRVGDPIPTAEYEGSLGRKALAERTREALVALGVPDALG
jgi:1-acyl-sn-glycerol-3-phosphate acyltransferase